jgi:GNAT superfamily N-acetyltransferase
MRVGGGSVDRRASFAHMLNEHIISQVTGYWASHLGCPTEVLFAEPLHIITHGVELADYSGIFALFRGGAATVSFPPCCIESFDQLMPAQPATPASFADAFGASGYVVVGPAYIGYAEDVRSPSHPVRSLTLHDASAVSALRTACTETEWEHGGSLVGEQSSSGVFVGGQLVALAGYEVWAGVVAHISVITHPDFRTRGFGRSAVAHIAERALSAGLIPQYRTLESNFASIGVADSLGFCHYATSVAVRLNRNS